MTSGVPLDDRGLTLGVGLFETICVVDGRLRLWTAHLDRLTRGCAVLGLPAPDAEACRSAAAAALDTAGLTAGRAALRLSWTGGSGGRGLPAPQPPQPRLFATASPAPPPPAGLALATVPVRRNPSSPTSRLKTLSYLDNVQARAEALAAGADEALMLDTAGRLACAAAANLFWLRDGTLFTPALDCGVLDGVVRTVVLALAPGFGFEVAQVRAPPTALLECDAAFLTSSLMGAVPVTRLDGAGLPAPPPRLQPLLFAVADAAEIAAPPSIAKPGPLA